MYKTALESGLSDVSTESVNLMMHALEVRFPSPTRVSLLLHPLCQRESYLFLLVASEQHHLKDIISTAGQPGRRQPQNQPRVLTSRDLLATRQTSPYLLGENLPVNQERILIMQEDY